MPFQQPGVRIRMYDEEVFTVADYSWKLFPVKNRDGFHLVVKMPVEKTKKGMQQLPVVTGLRPGNDLEKVDMFMSPGKNDMPGITDVLPFIGFDREKSASLFLFELPLFLFDQRNEILATRFGNDLYDTHRRGFQ